MQHYTVNGSQQFHRKQSKTAYGCPKLIMWVENYSQWSKIIYSHLILEQRGSKLHIKIT